MTMRRQCGAQPRRSKPAAHGHALMAAIFSTVLLWGCGGGGGPASYALGGTITGLTGTLVLQDNGHDDLSLSANGAFRFAARSAGGAAYDVTVRTQPAQQTCVVSNGSGSVGTSDVSDVSVTCSTNVLTVGGSVTGLVGTGLVLLDNGGDDLTIAGNGPFTFTSRFAAGSPYAVTVKASPSSPSQACTISGGSGTIGGADVTNVAVNCASGASGSLDPTFGNAGTLLLNAGTAQGVVVQGDGRIVIVASLWFANGNNSFVLTRFNVDGSLDASFGTGGQTLGNLGGLRPVDETIHALLAQADGKLIVAGTGTGLVNGSTSDDFALARYDANGNLDTTFGIGGKVFSTFGSNRSSSLWGLAIQTDGKLVAVGNTPGAQSGNDYNFAIARYLSDGSLDSSFGSGGTVVTDFGQLANDNGAESVAMQANGKIVVGGWNQLGGSSTDIAPALARYNADGSLDGSFGTGGRVSNASLIYDSGNFSTVLIQPDGKIVLARGADTGRVDFAMSRYNTDGSADTGFGIDGVVTTDFGRNDQDILRTALQQPDGKLLLGGYTQGPNGALLGLARYRADGSLDTAFGSGGLVVTDVAQSGGFCSAMAVGPNGKIVAVGSASSGPPLVALARYLP